MIGTGYVGLVNGTCLAETGNHVVCVDCDRRKIALLGSGKVAIYEPGLAELIARPRRGRLWLREYRLPAAALEPEALHAECAAGRSAKQ